jgi:hypothetical protein
LSGGAVPGGEAIEVEIHEQLSAVYDDVSPESTCQVEGTIYALQQHPRRHQHQHQHPHEPPAGSAPFCLTLRDVLGQLDRVDANPDVCQNVSDRVSRQGLHRLDQVLRVRMPPPPSDPASSEDKIRVASYTSSIRPVPLVRREENSLVCRPRQGIAFYSQLTRRMRPSLTFRMPT